MATLETLKSTLLSNLTPMQSAVFTGVLSAHVAAVIANRLSGVVAGGKAEQVLDGFPRSRWILSAMIQGLVFPSCMYLSLSPVLAGNMGWGQWLMAPGTAFPDIGRWYIYALIASQTRDMPMAKDVSTLMKVHHWVVIGASLLALWAPQAFGLFCAGTFALEVGSLTFNLRTLFKQSSFINVLYQVVMATSNILAVLAGLYLAREPGTPVAMKAFFVLANIGVCLGRQRHALKDAGLIGKPNTVSDNILDNDKPSGVAASALNGHSAQNGIDQGLRKRSNGRSLAWGMLSLPVIRLIHNSSSTLHLRSRPPPNLHWAGPRVVLNSPRHGGLFWKLPRQGSHALGFRAK